MFRFYLGSKAGGEGGNQGVNPIFKEEVLWGVILKGLGGKFTNLNIFPFLIYIIHIPILKCLQFL